jgi:hypothetical protein
MEVRMSQSDLVNKVNDLNKLILEGKAMDGFEKYYDETVSMQENDAPPMVGKSANREREIQFFGSITEFRGAKVLSVAAAADKTYVEWFFDYTHKDWGKRTYHQVAVQTWRDGKIVNEKFYYGGS